MSRALNIKATPDHIQANCAKRSLQITAIEALPSGGTRVVMSNSEASLALAKVYGSKVITGAVTRTPLRPARLAA
jgi:hypothetical protein